MLETISRPLAARLVIFVLIANGAIDIAVAQASDGQESTVPRRFETDHQAVLGGARVRYKAIVAESFLENAQGQRAASLISISYIRSNAPRGSNRPVVFVFNGGPGSSSVWTHMGLVGPRRVHFGDEVNPQTTPPFQIADNPDSILDVADVVLFDPPGTGFSRVLPDGKPEQFYGVMQDAQATVGFIEDWVTEHGRWHSPRFLMGESYGTVRAAVVAKLLAGGPLTTGHMEGLTLNGVILLGQSMNFGVGELSYANGLSSFAATAWYHDKIDRGNRSLEQHVAESEAFAADQYVRALYAGARLGEADRIAIADRIAGLTGLSREFVLEKDLRISRREFSAELLRDEGKQVGSYDSRFTLPLKASGGDPVSDDPAMGQYVPAFIAVLNSYVRDELGVAVAEKYRAIEFREVNARWDYGAGPGSRPARNFADDLAAAMRRNPALRLLVGTGYYDLVTTMGAASYMLAHTDIPPDRVTKRNYESGHMPYLGGSSLQRLARDLRAFINEQ
jgi:carboxypeptidase C (cathepsin A)